MIIFCTIYQTDLPMDICFLYLLHWSVDIISAKTRHCQTGVRAADNRNIQPDGKHPGIKIAIGSFSGLWWSNTPTL